jgi:hypothetical protein
MGPPALVCSRRGGRRAHRRRNHAGLATSARGPPQRSPARATGAAREDLQRQADQQTCRQKGEPRLPVTLCVLGDFGFRGPTSTSSSRPASVSGSTMRRAPTASAATPVVTLALDARAARGQLPTCESVPTPLQTRGRVVGAVWLDSAPGGCTCASTAAGASSLRPASRCGIASHRDAQPGVGCGECDLMAVDLPAPAEARACAFRPRRW